MRPLGEDGEWPGFPKAFVAFSFRGTGRNRDGWNPCECAPMQRTCAPALQEQRSTAHGGRENGGGVLFFKPLVASVTGVSRRALALSLRRHL